MQIGIFNLLTKRDPAKASRKIYQEMRDQVRLAEDTGFDTAWFTEHHFSNYCLSPSPLTMATWMAGQTSRIKLGTAVVVTPFYEPLRMLEDIAVLDQVSDGRLVLGLGSGYQRYEFHKFGLDLGESRDHFLESLDVIEQFFRNDSVAYEGRYLKIPETWCSVRPHQSMPEILVAGLLRDAETQQRMARSGYTALNSAGGIPMETVLANRAIVEGCPPGGRQGSTIHAVRHPAVHSHNRSPRGGARCSGPHAFHSPHRRRDARRLCRARRRLAPRATDGG